MRRREPWFTDDETEAEPWDAAGGRAPHWRLPRQALTPVLRGPGGQGRGRWGCPPEPLWYAGVGPYCVPGDQGRGPWVLARPSRLPPGW